MSWPLVKPPWKHVNWLTWPQQNTWITGPAPQWSEVAIVRDVTELDSLKQEIEKLDSINEWEFLKRTSNPYELVFSQSQDIRIPQSICTLKPLSRSFFKMVEILVVMDFFKRHTVAGKKPVIKSAHVCEGPGGFIEALLKLASKNSFIVESAWAMTLKPTKNNIPGWKRAYHFLRNSPMIHIDYGADDTGDIMVPVNQGSFLEKTKGRCQLFTADGGFDFSEHYGTQEEEVLPLLISSALLGLQTLVKGGDFVLKIFDTESRATMDLIALLASCFDSWTLYKPSLSRPCNAEKYFLGKGSKVIPGWILKTLVEIRNAYTCGFKHMTSIFPEMPEHFINDITQIKKEYLEQQISALRYALDHRLEWNSPPYTKWKEIQEHSVQWCRQFQMPIRPFTGISRVVEKSIPWNQVVASHKYLEDGVPPE